MADTVSATELVRRWQSGDGQAASVLFDQYARQLGGIAEQYLNDRLSGRLDREDIIQSVFRTFFSRSARGEISVQSNGQLWQLLVAITLAKVRDQARRHTAGKRGIQAEVDRGGEWTARAVANDPGPLEAVMLVDQIESLLKDLPEMHGQVLSLALAGNSRTEIAAQLQVSRQTVYRILNLLQERLEKTEIAV